jgi:hypothetical protein
VDVVAAVGADEQSAAVVQPGEGALDDPALVAQSGAVLGLTACDQRLDPTLPEQPAVLVVVVAAVGDQHPGPSPGPANPAANRRHPIEQFEQLSDVVAVTAGQRPGERDPAAVYEQVVLAPCPAAVNRAGTGLRAPFFACR